MKKVTEKPTLLQAQALFAALLLALLIGVKYVSPQTLTTLRQQYASSMRATPVWTLDDIRAIAQPAKDAFLRLFHA